MVLSRIKDQSECENNFICIFSYKTNSIIYADVAARLSNLSFRKIDTLPGEKTLGLFNSLLKRGNN